LTDIFLGGRYSETINEEDDMKINPEKFKEVVEASGLTARELAEAGGWTGPRRIWQIMAGKSTTINPRIGEAIARKLKVKPADITKGE
jgi:hypothetical protein